MLCENVRYSQHILLDRKARHPRLFDLKDISNNFSFDNFSNSVSVQK